MGTETEECYAQIAAGKVNLEGELCLPPRAGGIVVFAHGSGSSRHSPRNRMVARVLRDAGLATLLFDLLTPAEEAVDIKTAELRFNIGFLAQRLIQATDWVKGNPVTENLALGYFGASTGAAAALVAAAQRPDVKAVVSRGGRPDLAIPVLLQVKAPTLLIVGGYDTTVISMNREALKRLNAEKELVIVPGASHLFEEPGTLDRVAELARDWFLKYLVAR